MAGHSDHPTIADTLGRIKDVEAKALQIVESTPPKTFGIHGDWGAGKTSFLRQLRYHLDGSKDASLGNPPALFAGGQYEKQVVTVWFDAWRYQHEAAPVIALLQAMRREFSLQSAVVGKVKKLGEVTFRSILNSLDDMAKFLKLEAVPLSTKRIEETGEKWEKEHLETRFGVDSIQEFLESAIDTLLKGLGKTDDAKVVVFIDDLDRCSPDAAYRLLEGLKVYLGLKNCVFILGMNQQLVVDAIAACIPKELSPADAKQKEGNFRVRAEAYLEKLCTDIERLVPPADSITLLAGWLTPGTLQANLVAAATFNSQIARCLPPNPRRIKALANALNNWWPMVEALPNPAAITTKIQCLLVITYVYQFHSEIFQRWQFNPSFYTHLKDWSVNPWPQSVDGKVKDWPGYFAALQLPETAELGSSTSPTPLTKRTSTFPDPYAANVFWIAPLIANANLTETDMLPVMQAVVRR